MTIYERFREVAQRQPNHLALLGPDDSFQLTYAELDRQVQRAAAALIDLGLHPGDRVAILSHNRPEWVVLDLACNRAGLISVPIHTSVVPAAMRYILADSGCSALCISATLREKLGELSGEDLLIVSLDAVERGSEAQSWPDLMAHQSANPPPATRHPATIFSIMYTSGTTGEPKGVAWSDAAVLHDIDAALQLIPLASADRWCSFLPMSHALERVGGLYTPLLVGAAIALARGAASLGDGLKRFHPTVLVSVPRVFERAYEKIAAQAGASPLKKKVFQWALRSAKHGPLRRVIAEQLVWKKVRASLGGRLTTAISGGASLNSHIAKFFKHLGLNIIEGYGLTETSPIVAVNPADAVKLGTVGKAIPGVTIRVSEEKEILVAGPNVAPGYWTPSGVIPLTDADGWFATGDLGHLDRDGYLTIIGRLKELIVLPNGQKVNPVAIEQRLEVSDYFEQAFVYLDTEAHLISALLVPSHVGLQAMAKVAGQAPVPDDIGAAVEEWQRHPAVVELLRHEIVRDEHHLPEYERVKQWQLTWPPFSEDRQELTPTLKLRRAKIMERLER